MWCYRHVVQLCQLQGRACMLGCFGLCDFISSMCIGMYGTIGKLLMVDMSLLSPD
jgi:hypothetical protein